MGNQEYNAEIHEALSIVLESAKYLHNDLIEERRFWNDNKLTLKLDTVVSELTQITKEQANKLGVEVDNND